MQLNKLCNLWKFRSPLSFQLSTINAIEQTVQSLEIQVTINLRKFRSQLSFRLSTINAIEQTVQSLEIQVTIELSVVHNQCYWTNLQSLEIQVTIELSVVHNQCNWTNCAILGNSGHNWAFSCPQSMQLNKLCNLRKFRSQLSFQLSTINAIEQTVQS